MVGAWQRWSASLARSTERDFERMVLPFLRVLWPDIDQVPARRQWDAKGIDLLVWREGELFPCAVQCKGFVVQDIGQDQLRQVLASIDSFSDSAIRCETYIVLHNRDGKNAEFRTSIETRLKELTESGQVSKAELWDRQKFLTTIDQRLQEIINASLREHSYALLKNYQNLFVFGDAFVPRVPAQEFALRFRRYEPCTRVAVGEEKLVSAEQMVLEPTRARWTLLTAQFGMGKTTTVLHAAISSEQTVVLIECRSLPDRQDQLTSTSLLLEESLKSLAILGHFSDADQQVLYEVTAVTFKNMLKRPRAPFVLILDGLDENRFYSRVRGLEFLSNQLADFECPVLLTTRLEHLNAMFGDFSSAFEEFSVKRSPTRDARLIQLNSWTIAQTKELCSSALKGAGGTARENLLEFAEILEDSSFVEFYGDLPRNPLMLQFILEDVVEYGVRLSNRSSLLESWIKKKIRRDRLRTTRLVVEENLDVEDLNGRILNVMERAAGRMIDPETHELLEIISSKEVLDLAAGQFGSIDMLGLILNSLLLPVRERQGDSLQLAFAFRVVQEYFLARYLLRNRQNESLYPESVRNFVAELGGMATHS
ncbi:MAG TPA: hypothetical protein VGK01_23970 [Candidatus Angelobacter sp.]|jgi:hypothetical protein